jgi:hypothetical protein
MPTGAPAILSEVTSGFPQVLQENVDIILRLDGAHFPQNLFLVIVHVSSFFSTVHSF